MISAEFERLIAAHSAVLQQDQDALASQLEMHQQVEAALRERARRFQDLLEALPAAVYTTDAQGRITFYNKAAVELWGRRPELGKAEWCGSWRLYWPDGRPMRHDECPMATALKENREVRGAEAIAERPDGTRVSFIPYPTPLRDSSGTLIGAVNMLVDITHRKEAEERALALAAEVVHRTNNLLAVVQSTVRLTKADNVEAFKSTIQGRIQALGHVQGLLAQTRWSGVELGSLVDAELRNSSCAQQLRVHIEGPEVMLDPQSAQSMAMALHELTTNAAKYGALSVPSGRVEIAWSCEDGQLHFCWAETGGPAVKSPRRRGFGTSVIVGMIRHQLDGKVRFAWRKEGLVCDIRVPLRDVERRTGASG